VIVDTTYVKPVPEAESQRLKVIEFPISAKARELGREIAANIVALGLLVETTGIVPKDAAVAAVLDRVPKGTEELNKQAFAAGVEAAKAL